MKKSQDNTNLLSDTITLDSGIYKLKAKAYDAQGHTGETTITIGIKTEVKPTETPAPTP
jgi:hypothetical protein